MGMPARKLQFEEVTVEDRLGRLESTVEHIQSDVSEIKGDIRHLDGKIDAFKDSVASKFDAQRDLIAAQTVSNQKSITNQIIWTVGVAGTLLGAMAHGFHWL